MLALRRARVARMRRSSCLPVPSPTRSRRTTGNRCIERLELVEHARAFPHRGAPGNQQRPDRGENPASTRRGDALIAEDAPGRGKRVDAIRLSRSSILASRALHFDDAVSGVLQVLAQTGAPAAGTLDPKHEPAGVRDPLGPVLLPVGVVSRENRSLDVR
jgi:hypothetical protein